MYTKNVREETTKSRLRNQVLLARIERLDAQKPILKQGMSIKGKYMCSTVVVEWNLESSFLQTALEKIRSGQVRVLVFLEKLALFPWIVMNIIVSSDPSVSHRINRGIFNEKYIRELQKATKAAKMSPNKRIKRFKIRTCVVHIAALAVQVKSPHTSQFWRSYVTVCASWKS